MSASDAGDARVRTELRGDVCVVSCLPLAAVGGLADELRAELARCRASGATRIVLDVADGTELGEREIAVLRDEADCCSAEGGELVVAAEDPAARRALASAALIRDAAAVPREAPARPGTADPPAVREPPVWERAFRFRANAASLPAARRRVTALAEIAGLEEPELFELSVAVGEALTNAVVHGSPGGAADEVDVRFFNFADEVAVEIVDGGTGSATLPVCAPSAWSGSGRGIHFMRALSDSVRFDCGPEGMHVLLIKRRH